MRSVTRRRFVEAISAALLTVAGIKTVAARLLPTPRQTEGPFYPDVMPSDTDNDLVTMAESTRNAGGEILNLTGRMLNAEGAPLANALVEIWQCDMYGNYLHTDGASSRKRDVAFQGYGRTRTDADGRYSFRTIKPVPYPGRTPHIHVKAHHPNGKALTTQMYVEGDPANKRDFLYQDMSTDERRRVTVALLRDGASSPYTGAFDIVLPWT